MRLDRVILRAIWSTLAAIGVLLLVMVLSCLFFFPSTLMNLSYDLGLEKSAVRNAERAYKLDGGVEYMAFAFSIAVDNKDYDKVQKYGEKIIADDEFEDYCIMQDKQNEGNAYLVGEYEQYVYGNTYAAQYRNGEKEEALANAYAVSRTFVPGNAVARILIASLQAEDYEVVEEILDTLLEWKELYLPSINEYLEEMITLAERYLPSASSGN